MSQNRELIFLILQFLDENNLKDAAHVIERQTGYFFDIKYFEDLLLDGKWDEAEKYLSGFTKIKDNRHSTKIYFEIRKQKNLEALDGHDSVKAIETLRKDLQVFRLDNEELFEDIALLLVLDDIRQHELLALYKDAKSARKLLVIEVKKLIEANPLFHGKLEFPAMKNQRLWHLINQGLYWQHLLCKNPKENPCTTTLFVDHVCQSGQQPHTESSVNNLTYSQHIPACPLTRATDRSAMTNPPVSGGVIGSLRDPDPTLEGPDVFDDESENMSAVVSDEVIPATTAPGKSHGSATNQLDDLPKIVVQTLNEESTPRSMDFHPFEHTVLLVGTSIGDIALWEVISGEKLLSRNFKVWDIGACSMRFKAALVKDSVVSVNCVRWSPDGSLFGIAYSKHIVQLYSYHGGNKVQQRLEIDAHVGGVNDLAYSKPKKLLLIISCGDDKTMKAWDVVSGAKMYTFEGHEAPVYSVCPHAKKDFHFTFSTSVDGKLKAWSFDNSGAKINYFTPGRCCMRMAYSPVNNRLFSCGTTKDGETLLVEWNESEGSIRRIYQGLSKHSSDVVQFDTTKCRVLAAGDEHQIKFWDMDNVELLATTEADGCLPASPILRFNMEGTIMAVFAKENRIKILKSHVGLNSNHHSTNASTALSESMRKLIINSAPTVSGTGVVNRGLSSNEGTTDEEDLKPELSERSNGKSKVREHFEHNKLSSQCKFVKLLSPVTDKISRLIYTHDGTGILALTSNAIHLFWKWPQNEHNLMGKVTTSVPPPDLWQPKGNSLLMTNDLPSSNLEEAMPFFALSKNDFYLISASGGQMSLFNMVTFKKMMTVMRPPPGPTCIAFHPLDSNIIAIGMDDSRIKIYNVRMDQIIDILKGHTKKVTSVAFSNTSKALLSSGADAEICVWDCNGWEKRKHYSLKIPVGKPTGRLDTYVQFHRDEVHFLAVHETHLAIYDTTKEEYEKQWVPGPFCAPISHATFSCDSQFVYASFKNGCVYIFGASDLQILYFISPSAYLPADFSTNVYPVVIAAHPEKPLQFALGLSDGSIYILEPPQYLEKWPKLEKGSASSLVAASPFAASSSNPANMKPFD